MLLSEKIENAKAKSGKRPFTLTVVTLDQCLTSY